MPATQPQPKLPKVVAAALKPGRAAHDRQRDLVRASLLLARYTSRGTPISGSSPVTATPVCISSTTLPSGSVT